MSPSRRAVSCVAVIVERRPKYNQKKRCRARSARRKISSVFIACSACGERHATTAAKKLPPMKSGKVDIRSCGRCTLIRALAPERIQHNWKQPLMVIQDPVVYP